MKRILYAMLITMFVSACVQASPTINGPTGLVMMPTAEGLKYKEFNTGLNYLPPFHKGEQDDDGETIGEDKEGVFSYYANLGTFEGFEIGFTGKGGREGVFINMKYYLVSDTTENPLTMAIGLQNLCSYYDTGLYMVASKQMNMSLGLHFGFLGRFYSGTSDTNMMFGTKYFLNEQWALLLDTVGEHNVYSWNIGMQVQLAENVALNLSGINLLNPVERNNSIFVIGLAYTGFM